MLRILRQAAVNETRMLVDGLGVNMLGARRMVLRVQSRDDDGVRR